MGLEQFKQVVTTAEQLMEVVGTPSELVLKKQLSELDGHMRTFLASSPFLLLGTVDSNGRCDVSPRGDFPSVARPLDSKTVVVAEWRGNRRVDTLSNILETGRVGMLFLTPGLGETLRINGRACVVRDDDVLASLSKQGKSPELAIGVEVEECYFQCAKAVMRSRIWEAPAEGSEPPEFDFATVLVDQTEIEGQNVETLREQIEDSYRNRLY